MSPQLLVGELEWLEHATDLFEAIRSVFRSGGEMCVSLRSIDSRDLTDVAQIGGFAMVQAQAIYHVLKTVPEGRSKNGLRLLVQYCSSLLSFLAFVGSDSPVDMSLAHAKLEDRMALTQGLRETRRLLMSAMDMLRTPDP